MGRCIRRVSESCPAESRVLRRICPWQQLDPLLRDEYHYLADPRWYETLHTCDDAPEIWALLANSAAPACCTAVCASCWGPGILYAAVVSRSARWERREDTKSYREDMFWRLDTCRCFVSALESLFQLTPAERTHTLPWAKSSRSVPVRPSSCHEAFACIAPVPVDSGHVCPVVSRWRFAQSSKTVSCH